MLDIGEVAKRSGLPTSTLRFYEEKGLIESIGRKGLRRQFDNSVLDRLALVVLGQQAGFSLDEMKRLLASGELHIDRRVLSEKADQLDETIKKLKTMSRGLRHAAKCQAPSHFECPKFQRIMRAAKHRFPPFVKEG